MKSLLALVPMLALAAACNTSESGANNKIQFTPTNCGVVAGCDFTDSIGVGGKVDVQITGLDGTATAGLDLASRDTSKLTVAPTADINGAPAWELTALASGVVDLAAVDTSANEVDFVQVPVQDVIRLQMDPFVNTPVIGNDQGYDQTFTMNPTLASWYIRPLIDGNVETMGRYTFDLTLNQGDPDITQYATANDDRTNGYLYVNPPVGDYPVEFGEHDDLSINVTAIIHVVAP